MNICLAMIVKNESAVIKRCLSSVRPYINHYLICDTGSTDNTKEIITNTLSGIPGEVFDAPWVDFSTNRNLALEKVNKLSDIEWILLVDADEVLVTYPQMPTLDPDMDCYYVKIKGYDFEYYIRRLIKNSNKFRYTGRTHEVLIHAGLHKEAKLEHYYFKDMCDSARRASGRKFINDAEILEEDLKLNPNNSRSQFYLAESYKNMHKIDEAIKCYNKRATMGGWEEEVYYSLYQLARLKYTKSKKIFPVIEDHLKAYHYRPHRLEALTDLCSDLRAHGAWNITYEIAKDKGHIVNNDILFVTPSAAWRIKEEYALAAYHLGKKTEANRAFREILDNNFLTVADRQRTEKNLTFC